MIRIKEGLTEQELIQNGFCKSGTVFIKRIKCNSFEMVIRVNNFKFNEEKDISILLSPTNILDVKIDDVAKEYRSQMEKLIEKELFYEVVHDFSRSIINGSKGEKIIHKMLIPLLKQKEIEFEDVSGKTEYQELDIDFIIKKGNEKIAVEVKTDSYVASNNMFYEEMSCKQTGSIGCFHKTKANVMLYYYSAVKDEFKGHSKNHDIYVIYDMNKFKDWFEEHKSNFLKREILNFRYTKEKYTAMGKLIPRDFLDKEMISCDFAVRFNLLKDNPELILRAIQRTVPYAVDEDIKSSSKVRLKPMFKQND